MSMDTQGKNMPLTEQYNAALRRAYAAGGQATGYHVTAIAGWLNDPRAIYFNGQYHIFYNCYPFEKAGLQRAKAWGHIVTEDFIHYTHLPCAIAPDCWDDKDACASGCCVAMDDKLYLCYTARNEDRKPRELQAFAVSDDGVRFDKTKTRITHGEDVGKDCRDPKIWRDSGGKYYMVLGNTCQNKGRALLLSSDDLAHWTDEGVFCEGSAEQGFMWECPDFITVADSHFLILSPEGISDVRHSAVYLTGTLSADKKRFIQKDCFALNYGGSFYAPYTFDAADGRKLMVAWLNKWYETVPEEPAGFGGITIPVALGVSRSGRLTMQPIDELTQLRQFVICETDTVSGDMLLPEGGRFELRVKIDVKKSTAKTFSILLRADADFTDKAEFVFDLINRRATYIPSKHRYNNQALVRFPVFSENDGVFDFIMFVDDSACELFINEGLNAFAQRIYADEDHQGVRIQAKTGSLYFKDLAYYPLKSCSFAANI